MAVDKEYWNIPKTDELLSIPQGTNLTVFVDYADDSIFLGLSASDIVSLMLSAVGLVIGFFAYKAASKASQMAESANKLAHDHAINSIKPFLNSETILHGGVEGDIKKQKNFKFEMTNSGVGPAVVTNAYLIINGIEIYKKGFVNTNCQTYDNRKLIEESLGISNSDIRVKNITEEFFIGAGDKFEILYFTVEKLSHIEVTRITNKIEFFLEYSDIYGNEIGKIRLEPNKGLTP